MDSTIDPGAINLKVGMEIHQQLATNRKLFCCSRSKETEKYDGTFVRKLRPTQSELGSYDPAVLFEFKKMRTIKYHASTTSSCLVEADEETAFDDQYWHAKMEVETGDERYQWLTQSLLIARGRRTAPTGVAYEVFRVL